MTEMSFQVALLHDSWYPNTGGGIIHVEKLAEYLAKNHNCSVDIITKSTDGSHQPVDSSVNVVQISGTNTNTRIVNEFRYSYGVLNQIYRNEYDIIHAHTNNSAIILQLLRFSEESTIFTVHGADLDFNVTFTGTKLDSVYSNIRKIILKKFKYNQLISVSSELERILSNYHSSVSYIPNGVDVDEFPEPTQQDSDEILFVGRLRPKKNPEDIIKAMPYILESHPEAHLHIVGEGPLYDSLAELVSAKSLTDSVTLHGYVSDEVLNDLYSRCKVFPLVSEWEGHPLVLLEAWASGMVVVGSDVEGIREFIKGQPYGELVPLHDPKQLAKTISNLLDDQTELNKKAVDARDFVSQNYTWEQTADRTFQVYQSLTETSRLQ